VTDTKKNRKKRRPTPAGPEYVFDDERIQPPPEPRRGAYKIYFPLSEMQPGSSFTTKRTIGTLRRAVRLFRREGHVDQEFKVRPIEGGCRVWRVK
jgi:hypothetical protein